MEQNLQGCVLAPLLFDISVAVTNEIYTHFRVDKDIVDALSGGSNRRRASPGGVALGHALR